MLKKLHALLPFIQNGIVNVFRCVVLILRLKLRELLTFVYSLRVIVARVETSTLVVTTYKH